MRQVYKVVTNENGNYYSYIKVFWENRNNELVLNYKLGQVLKPKIGKLFAFSTLEEARKWGRFCDVKIFIAETSSCKPAYCRFLLWGNHLFGITDFWKDSGKYTKKYYVWSKNYAPKGSLLCDDLKLIKEVK